MATRMRCGASFLCTNLNNTTIMLNAVNNTTPKFATLKEFPSYQPWASWLGGVSFTHRYPYRLPRK